MDMLRIFAVLLLPSVIAACSGGEPGRIVDPAPKLTYTIGGTVAGLSGSGLTLQNNGAASLSVGTNGSFSFPAGVAGGATYSVAIASQPTTPSQTCVIANSSGTVAAANITNIIVNCVTNTYSVGGTVSGLTGSGLILQNNSGNDLAVSSSGAFAFSAQVASGAPYIVSVKAQPTNPSQTCSVANASGNIANSDITNVTINCTTNTYALGGTVAGLSLSRFRSPLVLMNGNAEVAILSDGSFTFPSPVQSGSTYNVTVKQSPDKPLMTCSLQNVQGTITIAAVNNITVTCARSRGQFALITSQNNLLSYYRIATDGTLALVMGIITPGQPTAVAVDPSGQYAYVTMQFPGGIQAYAIGATGTLAAIGSTIPNSSSPAKIAVEPTGTYVYVANTYGGVTNQGSVTAYKIDAASGTLTEIDVFGGFNNLRGIAIDPSGRFIYTANGPPNTGAFEIVRATGRLIGMPGSPYSNGAGTAVPQSIAADPSGRFVYAVNSSSTAGITGFSINATSGVLQIIGGAAFPVYADREITVDPLGQYVVEADFATTYAVYSISSTGALTATSNATFPAANVGTRGLLFEASGQYLYQASSVGIFAYTLNRSTGTLTPISGVTPLAVPYGAMAVALY